MKITLPSILFGISLFLLPESAFGTSSKIRPIILKPELINKYKQKKKHIEQKKRASRVQAPVVDNIIVPQNFSNSPLPSKDSRINLILTAFKNHLLQVEKSSYPLTSFHGKFFHSLIKTYPTHGSDMLFSDFVIKRAEATGKTLTKFLNFVFALSTKEVSSSLLQWDNQYLSQLLPYLIPEKISFMLFASLLRGLIISKTTVVPLSTRYVIKDICVKYLKKKFEDRLRLSDFIDFETGTVLWNAKFLMRETENNRFPKNYFVYYISDIEDSILTKGSYQDVNYYLSLDLSVWKFEASPAGVPFCSNYILDKLRDNHFILPHERLLLLFKFLHQFNVYLPRSCYFKPPTASNLPKTDSAIFYKEQMILHGIPSSDIERWEHFEGRLASTTERALTHAMETVNRDFYSKAYLTYSTRNTCNLQEVRSHYEAHFKGEPQAQTLFCRSLSVCDDLFVWIDAKNRRAELLMHLASQMCDIDDLAPNAMGRILWDFHNAKRIREVYVIDDIVRMCLLNSQENRLHASCTALKYLSDLPDSAANIYTTKTGIQYLMNGELVYLTSLGFGQKALLYSPDFELISESPYSLMSQVLTIPNLFGLLKTKFKHNTKVYPWLLKSLLEIENMDELILAIRDFVEPLFNYVTANKLRCAKNSNPYDILYYLTCAFKPPSFNFESDIFVSSSVKREIWDEATFDYQLRLNEYHEELYLS